MRKIISAFLAVGLLALSGLAASPALASAPPKSLGAVPYKTALEEAAKDDKHIMIYFWATWCGYCKYFNEETLPDPTVSKLLQEFHIVSVDADHDPQKLAKKYKATGMPTFVFLSPEGEELMSMPGALPPDIFSEMLKFFVDRIYERDDADAYIEEHFQ